MELSSAATVAIVAAYIHLMCEIRARVQLL